MSFYTYKCLLLLPKVLKLDPRHDTYNLKHRFKESQIIYLLCFILTSVTPGENTYIHQHRPPPPPACFITPTDEMRVSFENLLLGLKAQVVAFVWPLTWREQYVSLLPTESARLLSSTLDPRWLFYKTHTHTVHFPILPSNGQLSNRSQ